MTAKILVTDMSCFSVKSFSDAVSMALFIYSRNREISSHMFQIDVCHPKTGYTFVYYLHYHIFTGYAHSSVLYRHAHKTPTLWRCDDQTGNLDFLVTFIESLLKLKTKKKCLDADFAAAAAHDDSTETTSGAVDTAYNLFNQNRL